MDYPIKFIPILKERIWGGEKLHTLLGKQKQTIPIGESWEISAIPGSVSIVENGRFKGKDLQYLIDTYKADFLGKKVYEKYGTYFPLLIKFIDAKSDLSVQLHPNDTLAKKRHQCFGKEEMWYIMEVEKDGRLLFGFNQRLSKESYFKHLNNKTLAEVLHNEYVAIGDVFHIPAGRVHAIGGGVILAEIQQSSDITYRLYDWDRTDSHGKSRELHTEMAVDAIDFAIPKSFKTLYKQQCNTFSDLIKSPNFTSKLVELDKTLSITKNDKDSFTIYICVDGSGNISTKDFVTTIRKGESLLIPASLNSYSIIPDKTVLKLLQVIP